MSSNQNHQLEAQIDRALKALPELPAPPTLIARVMQAIARNQALPWFRRAWQTWPTQWRVVSFALLAILFAGICFGVWELSNLGVSAVTRSSSFSILGTLWNTLNALWGAAVNVVSHLNKGLVIGCVAAIAFGYAMCAALGTFCFALARRAHYYSNEK